MPQWWTHSATRRSTCERHATAGSHSWRAYVHVDMRNNNDNRDESETKITTRMTHHQPVAGSWRMHSRANGGWSCRGIPVSTARVQPTRISRTASPRWYRCAGRPRRAKPWGNWALPDSWSRRRVVLLRRVLTFSSGRKFDRSQCYPLPLARGFSSLRPS